MGPFPVTPRMAVPPAPRTRPIPATPDPMIQEYQQPSLVPQADPTPIDLPGSGPKRTRTYYTPSTTNSLYPAGYGIHVGVSQKFLDELIKVESQEAGPVRDCILGAQVVGSQTTETSVHVRMVPNDDQAELEFQLSGVTRNVTENRTPQAIIHSEGEHRFELAKSVQFDGKKLLTRSPSAVMYPYQRNRAAMTPASAIPILGPLVSQYALGIAEQRRPASERITAQRISQKVVPQFNDSVDSRLSMLNSQLQDVIPKHLPLLGISEPTTRVRTTDRQMTVSFAWDTVRSCPEYRPSVMVADASELRVALHSEAVNIWLASLPLGGQEISVDDLERWQKELQRLLALQSWGGLGAGEVLSEIGRRQVVRVGRTRTQEVANDGQTPPGLGAPTILGPLLVSPPQRREKVPTEEGEATETSPSIDEQNDSQDSGLLGASQTQMILANENPLSIEFESGEAIITLTAAFRIAPAPQTGFHRIRIPVTSRLQNDELIVTAGTVRVESIDSSGPLSELTRAMIEKQVQLRLKPTSWPIERSVSRDKGPPVVVRLGELSSGSDWLSFVWGVKEPDGPNL